MRYILNNSGYIFDVSFGADISCDLGNCQQYTGDIPEGYTTLEEWHDEEIDRLNAWKIINGNLIYDPNKASELEKICQEQERNNRCVTKKELDTALADIETGGEITASNSDELKMLLPVHIITGEVITTVDSSSYEVKRIEVTSDSDIKNKITLISSTPNLLPNEAVTQEISGLNLTVNEDKSISITGEETGSGEFIVAGSLANNEPLFSFKANQEYYLTELPAGYNWNLYYYDGTERELVYNNRGGVIKFTENKPITQAVISWTSAEIIVTELEETLLTEAGEELITEAEAIETNVTIKPMLNVGNTALEYELHKENRSIIDLASKTLTPSENITIENGECSLGTIDRVINTYNPESVIYAIEDVNLEVEYYKSDLYEKTTAKGTLHLTNTYASTGAINKLVINDITAGSKKYLVSSTTKTGTTNKYAIDLTGITGTVDVVIEKGIVKVIRNSTTVKTLEDIYINTYKDNTYIYVENEPNLLLDCEYMLKSTFTDIFCTIVEKNASFKVLQDMIQLEVTRASEEEGELASRITIQADRITQEVTRATKEESELASRITTEADRITAEVTRATKAEGNLSSKITVEANKIEQIVTAVGNEDEEVTPASIVQSINEDTSTIKISADKVNISGTKFPTIQNSTGRSKIDAAYENTDAGYSYGILYDSKVHEFYGDFYHEGNNLMIKAGNDVHLHIFENMIMIGPVNGEASIVINGNVDITGSLYVNGKEVVGTD